MSGVESIENIVVELAEQFAAHEFGLVRPLAPYGHDSLGRRGAVEDLAARGWLNFVSLVPVGESKRFHPQFQLFLHGVVRVKVTQFDRVLAVGGKGDVFHE